MSRLLHTVTITIVLVGGIVFMGPSSASAAECQDSPDPPSVGAGSNSLSAVEAVSRCSAWAVGFFEDAEGNARSLILYWDGTAWKRQSAPQPGFSSALKGVTATSSSNAWAVGSFRVLNTAGDFVDKTLILHWDGASWKRQSSPNRPDSRFNGLNAVTATSSTNAWAVGGSDDGQKDQTFILRYDGISWKRQNSPNRGTGDNYLEGVSATSSTNAWAVGRYNGDYDYYCSGWFPHDWCHSLILHWNGNRWKTQETPNMIQDLLQGVAATSSSNAWAVGVVDVWDADAEDYVDHTLILRWNGTVWKRQQSPNPGTWSNLEGVAATSSTNAWAVGRYSSDWYDSLVLHWDGNTWASQASPNVEGVADVLYGVAATSSTNAWAVGNYTGGGSCELGKYDPGCHSFILRSNGTAWSK